MNRSAYLIFSVLSVIIMYTMVYFGGKAHDVLAYSAMYFSVALVAANFLMAVGSLILWFLIHNEDISRGGITFLNAIWILTLAVWLAYKITSAGSLSKLFSGFR